MSIGEWCIWLFSKLPIIGGLPRTTRRDHIEALQEIRRSLLISTSPIWVGAFVIFIGKVSSPSPFSGWMIWECFKNIIKNGELFIYSATTLAPAMYIVTRDRENVSSFPSRHTFIDFVIIFTAISVATFTYQRVKPQQFPDIIIYISMIMFVLSIVIFYFALVYNNTFLANPGEMMRNEEMDYERRLREHRG